LVLLLEPLPGLTFNKAQRDWTGIAGPPPMQEESHTSSDTFCLDRCCDALILGKNSDLYVGCYELASDKRSGQIISFSLEGKNAKFNQRNSTSSLEYGILDMKYDSQNDYIITSNSNASISLFHTDLSGEKEIIPLDNASIQMGLDLMENTIITGGTNGYIHILQDFAVQRHFKAHSFDVWTCAFDYAGCNQTFWTGSDDCTAKNWDLRTNLQNPTHEIKWHSAGVCTVERNPFVEGQFVTGSYDDTMALWDARNLHKPLKNLRMNGGVWRVKWPAKEHSIVAVACMYGGSCLVDLSLEEPKIMKRFEVENKNISYGCIFARQDAVVTCSFYDKTLRSYLFASEHSIKERF
jgi:WD40 repeat protein